MYVNDPAEKALLPELIVPEENKEEEEPRDYHEFFGDDLPEQGMNYAGPPQYLYTQICRFDENGDHYAMAPDCPHFDQEDEMGRITRPGWTVQQ